MLSIQTGKKICKFSIPHIQFEMLGIQYFIFENLKSSKKFSSSNLVVGFLDAIASPSTTPVSQSVSQSVSGSLLVSDWR